MSIGAKKDGNNWYDLLRILIIGLALVVTGLLIASDRLFFSSADVLIDFGKYHHFIGLGITAVGAFYLFLALKGYLEES